MKQVTLVAFYGQKPEPLSRLIQDCAMMIRNSPLGRIFRPYHPDQVHGTIVGMEKLEGSAELYNKNTWAACGSRKVMDFNPLRPTLQSHLPITVQFGGFPPAFSAFSSSGLPPYERSFQVQWQANRFTLIGWPHRNGEFAPRQLLNELREDLNTNCKIRHKWGTDNDLFMVLGEIANTKMLLDKELAQLKNATPVLEKAVRDYLTSHKTEVEITIDDLYVAQYEVETLERHSTVAHRITGSRVEATFIRNLYK